MGMDYAYLEWVILAHTPFSLLGLMQSLGRVARGKRTGTAEIFWAEDDFRIAGFFLKDTKPDSRGARDLSTLRDYLEGSKDDKAAILRSTFI
jgi:superfamily II DNA helicase RecQ